MTQTEDTPEKIELTQDEFDNEYTIKDTIPKDLEITEEDRIKEFDEAIGATDPPEDNEGGS